MGQLIISSAQFEGENRLLVFPFQEDSVFESCGQACCLVKGRLYRRFIDTGSKYLFKNFMQGYASMREKMCGEECVELWNPEGGNPEGGFGTHVQADDNMRYKMILSDLRIYS
jgi:hypothetical protein